MTDFQGMDGRNKPHLKSVDTLDAAVPHTGITARDIRKLGFDDGVIEVLLLSSSEDSVAIAFALQFEGLLVFSHTHGKWFEWDGTRWKVDKTRMAFDYARHMARKAAVRDEKGPRKAAFCSGVEKFAKTDPRLARDGSEFDRNNYLLNCPDATYDLRAGTMHPHDPAENITHRTVVAPSDDGGKAFRKFLREITLEDEDLEAFLQVALGACLSGAMEDHWLMFWVGSGRNGKNTLADLVQYVMGDYARKITSSVLMASPKEQHPTDMANLQGARLAIASEIDDGLFWAESKVKELTGDAMLSGRFMAKDFFEFERTHKHLILGNHRPQVRTSDDALKSRFKIVPFKASFIGREDAGLPERLRKEADYVLRWLMRGHTAWLEQGRLLGSCAAVEAETEDYFATQSTVDMWLGENCKIIPDDGRGGRQWHKASVLYTNYSRWKEDRNEKPMSQTRWGERMTALNMPKTKAAGVRYVGIEMTQGFMDLS